METEGSLPCSQNACNKNLAHFVRSVSSSRKLAKGSLQHLKCPFYSCVRPLLQIRSDKHLLSRHAGRHVGVRISCPLFLSDFDQSSNTTNIEIFQQNPPVSNFVNFRPSISIFCMQ